MPSLFRSLSARFGRQSRSTSDDRETRIDRKRQVQCKVLLLDGTDLNIVVGKSAIGAEVYEQVFYSLDLEERDYFGLQFTDHYNVQHWLDPVKKIAKQVPIGPPFTFRFKVKFYTSEPSNNLKEELTRYQFFLQLKQDVLSGRLECSHEVAVELAAYALQSELGDFNPMEHTALLISEFRFHPQQDERMEIDIMERFKQCRGQTPAQAEMNYLKKAKYLEMYGVDMHTVEGKDGNDYTLGLTPQGMLVFDGKQKIGLFFWEKIQKLDFRNKKITLVVEEEADQSNNGNIQVHTFVFNLSSHKACKHLWKCAIEQHTFFRLKTRTLPKQQRHQLFRLGSTFKYRGRTEYETVHKDGSRLSRRCSSSFERRPSQRYVARQTHAQMRQMKRNEMREEIVKQLVPLIPTASGGDMISHLAVAESCQVSGVNTPITPSHNSSINNKMMSAEARLDNLLFTPSPTKSINSSNVQRKNSPEISHPPTQPIINSSSHITMIPIGTTKPNDENVHNGMTSRSNSRIPKYTTIAPVQDSVPSSPSPPPSHTAPAHTAPAITDPAPPPPSEESKEELTVDVENMTPSPPLSVDTNIPSITNIQPTISPHKPSGIPKYTSTGRIPSKMTGPTRIPKMGSGGAIRPNVPALGVSNTDGVTCIPVLKSSTTAKSRVITDL